MGLVIMLSLLIVATFIVLCHMFNESAVELDSPTIAAMEAHTEALEARQRAEEGPEPEPEPMPPAFEEKPWAEAPLEAAPLVEPFEPPKLSDYEYREMLEEGGGNFVLPQWITNFFSSSDICHTLDPSDNMLIIVKLSDSKNAETGVVDIYAECDMTTQTVSLKLGFGEGASAETFQTKFYLFARGSDYTLEYAGTARAVIPHRVLSQLKDAIAKTPA
jgi:hypothetical protein